MIDVVPLAVFFAIFLPAAALFGFALHWELGEDRRNSVVRSLTGGANRRRRASVRA